MNTRFIFSLNCVIKNDKLSMKFYSNLFSCLFFFNFDIPNSINKPTSLKCDRTECE